MTADTAVLGIANAYGLEPERINDLLVTWPNKAQSQLGLWNCQDDGFYRFIYHRMRHSEGSAWITNERTPAELLQWWTDYQLSPHANTKHPIQSR